MLLCTCKFGVAKVECSYFQNGQVKTFGGTMTSLSRSTTFRYFFFIIEPRGLKFGMRM